MNKNNSSILGTEPISKLLFKQQDEFTDYDFEGSGMSALLDVLHITLTTLDFMQTCLQMKCSLTVQRCGLVLYLTQNFRV